MTAASPMAMAGVQGRERVRLHDPLLLVAAALLLGLGLVMVGSASVSIADRHWGEPLHYFWRQSAFALLGLAMGFVAWRTPLHVWERAGPLLLIGSLLFLAVLLVPGLGRTVNGSTRWLAVGPLNLQVSEFAKLAFIIYLAGYLVRHGEAVRTTAAGFLKPMAVVGVLGILLLAEPDFGATVVLAATAMGMTFLGGVRFWLFGLLVAIGLGGLGLLAVSSPYRMERLTTFLNPWADPFNSGFQLTQALIAFGRGEWFGVGLGNSVQKLFYLPEAHTDFVMAVLAEELGLFGVLAVMALFALLVARLFAVGRAAARANIPFGTHIAYGVGIWLSLQVLINLGVNMGVLPTKGLTLPFLSYGGSSMLATCIALGLVLRVDEETRTAGGAA